MARTRIEWAEYSWNPFVGCSPVSEGCANCYARGLHSKRHEALREGKGMSRRYYAEGFDVVRMVDDGRVLDDVLKWRSPRRVFVNSMSDSFHEAIPDAHVLALLAACAAAEKHTFMLLTKRPHRAFELMHVYSPADAVESAVAIGGKLARWLRWERIERRRPVWPFPNIWIGASVENQAAARCRLPDLLAIPAMVRMVSCEPLLGPVDCRSALVCKGVDWVICGAETGAGARRMDLDWARGLRNQCAGFDVPFFFKKDSDGRRLLDGHLHEAWPEVQG